MKMVASESNVSQIISEKDLSTVNIAVTSEDATKHKGMQKEVEPMGMFARFSQSIFGGQQKDIPPNDEQVKQATNLQD